ncbi:PilZ domain-containing protein [Agrobacterium sp.]|uniref:PilZ domain-containing protein n=1 Tax=Agrobacterium sp. TaxID=361 RepID=UPI0028A9F6A7|nr:PilZ domain-containing protein [Agrobacterium sp.]
MSGQILRLSAAMSMLAIVAGCNSSSPSEALGIGETGSAAPAAAAVTPVVQANCPKVTVLDSNAIHRVYARGAKDNPEQLVYQASLADSTRACTMNTDTLTVNVLVQGRIVPGPQAKAGKVTLPIRVSVKDGEGEIFGETSQYQVDLSTDGGGQFIFNNDHVAIPNGPGGAPKTVNVFVAFDDGAKRK